MKFSEQEVDTLFSILSAILHLGNVTFNGDEKVTIDPKCKDTLEVICKLLKVWYCKRMPTYYGQVSPENMNMALTQRLFTTNRATTYRIALTGPQALENRDATAKALYSKLFDHLVATMNLKLSGNDSGDLFIAVLDIYGFEFFAKNGLEQFCINYANEKLNEQFNQHLFKVIGFIAITHPPPSDRTVRVPTGEYPMEQYRLYRHKRCLLINPL